MSKKNGRGRPARESLLGVRIRQRLENPPARILVISPPLVSISDLERHLGLPTDTIRDICRGRTGRNKVHKIGVLARVASLLEFPLDELAGLAGLTTLDRKPIDLGTPEAVLLRTTIAKGGDPRLCGTALGVLLAHGEITGNLGISQSMHDAGERFGRLASSIFDGGQRSKPSALARAIYETEAPPPPPTDAALSYNDACYRSAWRWLQQTDNEARRSALHLFTRPSVAVWRVAVRNELSWWATYDLKIEAEVKGNSYWSEEEWSDLIRTKVNAERPSALTEWLSLRTGLRALQRFFKSPEHAALWRRFKDEDEIERLGFDPSEHAHLVEEGMARLARRGVETD